MVDGSMSSSALEVEEEYLPLENLNTQPRTRGRGYPSRSDFVKVSTLLSYCAR